MATKCEPSKKPTVKEAIKKNMAGDKKQPMPKMIVVVAKPVKKK